MPPCVRTSTPCLSITAPRPAYAWPASTSAGTPRACRRRRSSAPPSIVRPKPPGCGRCLRASSCRRSIDRLPEMAVRPLKRPDWAGDQFPSAILDSLSEAVVVVDAAGLVHYANLSAEQFFGIGRARLVGHPLGQFLPEDAPLFSLLEQVVAGGGAVAESGVTLSSPRVGSHFCA